jgi:hypothetical protein
MNATRDRYMAELDRMPASGGGGCHTALLRVANFGRHAGVDPKQVAHDLRVHVHGARNVTDREIQDAISKAFSTSFSIMQRPVMRAITPRSGVNGTKLLAAIVERGIKFDEAELWETSPVRIDWPPRDDTTEVLRRLYRPDEQLFLGTRHDAGAGHVLPVSEWLRRIERGVSIPEHIIPNPLTGEPGLTKDGKPSFRADDCVDRFRFAVVEFDAMPRKAQIRFWAGVKLPVVALIDSGGKSVHGWIRIDAASADEWAHRVESKLFDTLTAVGADGACKNEARLSRVPGHFRTEKHQWQRVLYLNPPGGPVLP